MPLIRRDTRGELARRSTTEALDPFRIMDALLGGEIFQSPDSWSAARAFSPTFEVKETKDAYVFKADLPGVAEKDVQIHMTGNVLTVAGSRTQENVQEGERYFAVERGYGQFSRSFSLPDGTDAENVTADLKEGVLTLRVPKKPEVQARRIAIGQPGGAKA
jgi:HSP20 family protein